MGQSVNALARGRLADGRGPEAPSCGRDTLSARDTHQPRGPAGAIDNGARVPRSDHPAAPSSISPAASLALRARNPCAQPLTRSVLPRSSVGSFGSNGSVGSRRRSPHSWRSPRSWRPARWADTGLSPSPPAGACRMNLRPSARPHERPSGSLQRLLLAHSWPPPEQPPTFALPEKRGRMSRLVSAGSSAGPIQQALSLSGSVPRVASRRPASQRLGSGAQAIG